MVLSSARAGSSTSTLHTHQDIALNARAKGEEKVVIEEFEVDNE